MSFVLKIEAPGAGTAVTAIEGVERALDKSSAAAVKAREQAKRMAEEIAAAAAKAETAARAMGETLAKIGVNAFGKLTEQFQREAQVIERIRGPMREYHADLVALDMAHKRGALTTAEFVSEMERLTRSRRAANAEQAAKTIGLGPSTAGPDLKESALAVVGGIAAIGVGIYAVIEGARKIQGMVHALQDMHDVWIETSNAAIKFEDSLRDVNRVVAEQITLAHELHSNYKTTIGLYDTIRDGTDDLNFSHAEQVRVLETLGKASQVAGRSLESVGGLVEQLSYAAARGSIDMRQMDSIMRKVPDIAALWTEKFGVSRRELKALVEQGKISVTDLVAALATNTAIVDQNFSKIKRTGAQTRAELNQTIEIFQSQSDFYDSWASGIVKGLEAIHPEFVQKTWADLAVSFQENAETIAKAAERARDAIFNKLIKDLIKAPQQLSAALGTLKGYGDQIGRIAGIFSDPWGDDRTGFGAQLKLLRSIRQPIEDARVQLQNLRAEHVRGQITADEYQKQYETLVTTINDGRLPASIKLWHDLNDPIRDNAESIAALNAALATGGVTAAQYNTRVGAMRDALAKLRHETLLQEQALRGVTVGARAGGVYVSADVQPEAAARAAASLAEQAAALQSVTPATREYNEELNRTLELGRQLVAPQLAYEERLAEIQRAQAANVISQTRANQLTQQAADAYQSAQDQLAGYASVVEQFEGPAQRYQEGIRAAGAALEDGRISAEQYGLAVDRIRAAYLAASPAGQTFTGALEQSFLKAKLDAQSFGATLADTLVDNVGKLSDALVTMAMNGEVSWRKMIEAMLSDLARLAARQLLMGLINMGISAATGTPTIPGVSGPVLLPSQSARSGPGAYPMPTSGTSFASSAMTSSSPVVKIVNVFDQAEIHAAMDSRQGEQITVNQMRRNTPAVRSYSGTRR